MDDNQHDPARRPDLSDFDLTGRVAVVTGASKGIGAAIAQALAAAGAHVIATGRDQQDLDAVAVRIRATGGSCATVRLDTRDSAAVTAVRDEIVSASAVDVLVNNAGINIAKPALELTDEDFDDVVDTNLKGYFLVARAFGAGMVERGHGKIINVSSVFAEVGWPKQAAYAASKGGVAQLTRSLAVEWAPFGVRVNALAPSYTEIPRTMALYENTDVYDSVVERTPMRRWSVPDDLTGPAVFLAAPASDFITGQTLVVDGGYTSW